MARARLVLAGCLRAAELRACERARREAKEGRRWHALWQVAAGRSAALSGYLSSLADGRVCATRRMQAPASAPRDKRHRCPSAITLHAVWRSFRFALRRRDVAALLAACRVIVTDETIRRWCRKFGRAYANALRRRRRRLGDRCHLNAVFVSSDGVQHSPWRAVDQDGTVLDILAQRHRDQGAATKFCRGLLKGPAGVPRVRITDRLASYRTAKRGLCQKSDDAW